MPTVPSLSRRPKYQRLSGRVPTPQLTDKELSAMQMIVHGMKMMNDRGWLKYTGNDLHVGAFDVIFDFAPRAFAARYSNQTWWTWDRGAWVKSVAPTFYRNATWC